MMKSRIDKDFDLCSNVAKMASNKYGGSTPAGIYPEAERTVVLVWTVTGIIGNGGFKYLFSSPLPGDDDYAFTIEAFNRIGCIKVAETIKDAVALLNNRLFADEHGWLPEIKKEEMRDFFDFEFWEEDDNITTCLADYIREIGLDDKQT